MELMIERRADGERRIPLHMPVELSPDDLDDSFEADAVNLSPGGLSMRAPYLPDVGAQLRCRFDVPPGDVPIEVRGEVVWAHRIGARKGEFGFRFVDMPEDRVALIAELMAEHAALHARAGRLHVVERSESIGPEAEAFPPERVTVNPWAEDAPESPLRGASDDGASGDHPLEPDSGVHPLVDTDADTEDDEAELELDVGASLAGHLAKQTRSQALFVQPLDLLSVGQGLWLKTPGGESHRATIASVALRVEGQTPMLAINVAFDGAEASLSDLEWDALPASDPDADHDTVPDLETPGERQAARRTTVTEFSLERPSDAPGPADVEAHVPPALAAAPAHAPPSPHEAAPCDVSTSEPHAPAGDVRATGDRHQAITPVATHAPSMADLYPEEALERDAGHPLTAAGASVSEQPAPEPGEGEGPLGDAEEEVALELDATPSDDGQVGLRPDVCEPRLRLEVEDDDGQDDREHTLEPPALVALVSAAGRMTERLLGFAQGHTAVLRDVAGRAGALGRARTRTVGRTVRTLVRKPDKRRKTTAPRRAGSPRPQPAGTWMKPLSISMLAMAAIALGVYALAPSSDTGPLSLDGPVVDSPVVEASPSAEPIGEPARAPEPGAQVETVVDAAGVPQPASVPAGSPYAVDVHAPASRQGAAVASGPAFGAADVANPRRFSLRMTEPVKSLQGIPDAGGFTVIIPGSLSLDRAGPIASSHAAIKRSMILNKGDRSELTMRFVEGKSPAYRVVANGASITVLIGE